MLKTFLSSFILLLCLTACQDAKNYDKAAKGICDCQQPMIDKLEAMLAAQEAGKQITEAMLDELDDAITPISDCMDDVQEEFGLTDIEDGEKIDAAIQKICPTHEKIMERMEE